MPKEEWREIIWYESYYKISNLWNIKSFKKGKWWLGDGRLLKPCLWKIWYMVINLCKNNKVKQYYMHQLLAKMFISNIDNRVEVNHKNGIRSDNSLDNLEWCTHSENIKHSYDVLNVKSWFKKWDENFNRMKYILKMI